MIELITKTLFMLKNENIICISSIDWDFIWQGHQEIMSTLAENGNRVLFIENTGVRVPGIRDISRIKDRFRNWFRGVTGIRKQSQNLYIYSPLVLPFPYARFAGWINHHLIFSVLKRWIKVMDFSDPIIWTFLPTPLSLSIINGLTEKLLVYYCIDSFSVSSGQAKKIKDSEAKLLKRADLIFVTSNGLNNYCSGYNDSVHIFPFAVDFPKFEKARLEKNSAIEEFKEIKRPIIGYVGGIHKWIDQKLVKKTAENLKECSFVFVGPVQTDISLLRGLKNLYFLPQKDHGELPFYIKSFDICIIPYAITDYTKNVYPTKLNEYFAMGKSVVSTNLPEITQFNKKYADIVHIAENAEEFSGCIRRALEESKKEDLTKKYIDTARENSWSNTIEKMSLLIRAGIERKKTDIEAQWKERLISFYKKTGRKSVSFAAACFLIYIIFFKTPFLWGVAEPLRISQNPQQADAIVVFGGGVGEAGSPGKSTLERARYAADLYQKDFADKIIFSSGYTYTYNDAENMRLIALSMGVDDEDIILEQKSHSAYDNVRFSKEILDRNGWRSILLVSSPYNMRRVSFVFNKWADEIEIIYTPVRKSQFYARAEGVRLKQIRAIMHEYLGIIYYWLKGRI